MRPTDGTGRRQEFEQRMAFDGSTSGLPTLQRLSTAIPGLDDVLGGGLFRGDVYLVAGEPGTGKTTLGNQIAFAHAAAGGRVLFATLLTESHDRMLAHLDGFSFVDQALVGDRIQYVSLLSALEEGSLDGMLRTLVETMRHYTPTLLIIDGTGVAQTFVGSHFDFAHFIHGLQARTALLSCTTVLLSGANDAEGSATHVDGLVRLFNMPVRARDARFLRVTKLRGSQYLNGQHTFTIGDDGVVVSPRLEAVSTDGMPEWTASGERAAFGIARLDAMTLGGVSVGTSTLILGTPGAGKTVLGLQFVAEGANHGEPALYASFQEPATALASTAGGVGLGLQSHLDSGVVQVMWSPPQEMEPDEWAWRLLARIDEQGTRRLVIDAFSDLFRLFAVPERRTPFTQALANGLRDRGVTSLLLLELDAFSGQDLVPPVPNVSAMMDSAILLRTVELRSSLHRLVSILKQRETAFDPAIREFEIGPHGIMVGDRFHATDLLTGSAVSEPRRT